MHLLKKAALLVLLAIVSLCGNLLAQDRQNFTNGGLETGTFTGWNLQDFAAGGGGGGGGGGGEPINDPAHGRVYIPGDFYSPQSVKGGEMIIPLTLGTQTFTKATIDFDIRNLQTSTGFTFPFMSFVIADLISTEPRGSGYRLDYKYEFNFSYFIRGHSAYNGSQHGDVFQLGLFWICPFKGTNDYRNYGWTPGRAYHVQMEIDTLANPQFTKIRTWPKDNPADVRELVTTSNQWRVKKFRGAAYVLILGVRELHDPIFNSRGATYSNLDVKGTLATGDIGGCSNSNSTGLDVEASGVSKNAIVLDSLDDLGNMARIYGYQGNGAGETDADTIAPLAVPEIPAGDDAADAADAADAIDVDELDAASLSKAENAVPKLTGQHVVVSGTTTDPNTGGFVVKYGGQFASKLGDLIPTPRGPQAGSTNYRSFMTQKIKVAATDPVFHFAYAIVAQPGGSVTEAAGVRLVIINHSKKDAQNQPLKRDHMDNAWDGRVGWRTAANGLAYKVWTEVHYEVDPSWAGDDLEIFVDVHDSVDGQRAALAYFDEFSVGQDPSNDSPFGFVDSPLTGATVQGVIPVYGWALDRNGVQSVELYVDGARYSTAEINLPYPGVAEVFPTYPNKDRAGWGTLLDTRSLSNGQHSMSVRVKDILAKVSFISIFQVNVAN